MSGSWRWLRSGWLTTRAMTRKSVLSSRKSFTFTVDLSNPVDAEIEDPQGMGTIVDDEACPGPNLLSNPGAEAWPVAGQLPSWTALAGTIRHRRLAPVAGKASFFAGQQAMAELWQDVDVSAFEENPGDRLALADTSRVAWCKAGHFSVSPLEKDGAITSSASTS